MIAVASTMVVAASHASATRIFTIAGSGWWECPQGGLLQGDAAPATTVRNLCPGQSVVPGASPVGSPGPGGIVELPTGDILTAARGAVYRIDTNGLLRRLAGAGPTVPLGDGGPALSASLIPTGLAAEADGSVLVGDYSYGARVRRIDRSGRIETVAGTGASYELQKEGPSPGDGGEATAAPLNTVNALAVLPGRGFVVADTARFKGPPSLPPGVTFYPQRTRIRLVSRDGKITTVAGSAWNGDTSSVVTASINGLLGLTALPSGGFAFLAQSVAWVQPNGAPARTLEGFGVFVVGTDNRVRLVRRFKNTSMTSVTATADGRLIVGFARNERRGSSDKSGGSIWEIDPSGRAKLIGGGLSRAHRDVIGRGDGGSPLRALIYPNQLAVGPGGEVFVQEPNRIRLITPLPGRRMAVEISPRTLRSRRTVSVAYTTTLPATVRVTVRVRGRVVASATGSTPGGDSSVVIPRRLPSGQNIVTLTAIGSAGQVAVDKLAMLPNGWLPAKLAKQLMSPFSAGGTPVGNAAGGGRIAESDGSGDIDRLGPCRRFSRRRVDCRYLHIDDVSGDFPGKRIRQVIAVRLGRNGRLYMRRYGCCKRGRFKRKLRWRGSQLLGGGLIVNGVRVFPR